MEVWGVVKFTCAKLKKEIISKLDLRWMSVWAGTKFGENNSETNSPSFKNRIMTGDFFVVGCQPTVAVNVFYGRVIYGVPLGFLSEFSFWVYVFLRVFIAVLLFLGLT